MIARYLTSETFDAGPELQPWVDALVTVDSKKGDKTELLRLLNSETPIPSLARLYLADLLDRKKLRLITRYSLPETSSVGAELQPWIDALLAIDEGDKSKLRGRLLSDTPIPTQARHHLVDLIRCNELGNPKNNLPTPLYKFSDHVSKLARAKEAVRYLRKYEKHKSLDSVIEETARNYKLTPEAVRKVHLGTDSNFRTMVKSRPHLKRRPR
jgi:hypothetical protein